MLAFPFDECRDSRTIVRLQLETEYQQGLFMLILVFFLDGFFSSFLIFLNSSVSISLTACEGTFAQCFDIIERLQERVVGLGRLERRLGREMVQLIVGRSKMLEQTEKVNKRPKRAFEISR